MRRRQQNEMNDKSSSNVWVNISTLDIAVILDQAPPETTCCINCADIVGKVVFSLNGCNCVVAKMKLPSEDPSFHYKQITDHPTIHMVAHLMSFFSKSVEVTESKYIFKEVIHVGHDVISLILNTPGLRCVCDTQRRTLTIENVAKSRIAESLHKDIDLSTRLAKLVHNTLIQKGTSGKGKRKRKIKRLHHTY